METCDAWANAEFMLSKGRVRKYYRREQKVDGTGHEEEIVYANERVAMSFERVNK